MATYTVTPPNEATGFSVAIVGDNGARQTLLGFDTQEAADAWVLEDRRISAAESNLRMPWRF